MIGYGNIRSNLSRALSWMANRYGVKCYIISPVETDLLSTSESQTNLSLSLDADDMTFNRRLSLMFGANIINCSKNAVAACVDETMNRLQEEGEIPYYIYGNALGQATKRYPLYLTLMFSMSCYSRPKRFRLNPIIFSSLRHRRYISRIALRKISYRFFGGNRRHLNLPRP